MDGGACATIADRPGTCAAGICVVGAADEIGRKCRVDWDPAKGVVERCSTRTRLILPKHELANLEASLARSISEELRYDVRIALVEVDGGGYNIIALNRRERHDVRGLVDPSFIAFNVAGYTAKTDWRSRNLHVWLEPYQEGWGLSTRDSRGAVQYGQQKSALGFLGVVDVKGFRVWLEREFYPLKPSL